MQLVVDIPEDYYRAIKEIPVEHSTADMMIIRNGTPLPKGHGRLIYAKDVGEYLTLADVPTIIEADAVVKKMQDPGYNLIKTELEPCEDAISRKAALECCRNEWEEEVEIRLKSLPPVTPQPKTGHWIRWYEQKENDGYIEHIPHCKCSECGKEYDPHSSQFVKYCNECGAKMVEPQERK